MTFYVVRYKLFYVIGFLREYFLVHENIEDALKAIECINDKRQLMASLQKERAGRKEAVKDLAAAKTKDKYKHAIDQHGAKGTPEHNMSRAQKKSEGQGQWYNNNLIVEADKRFELPKEGVTSILLKEQDKLVGPGNLTWNLKGNRWVLEASFGKPAGRVFLADGRIISEVDYIWIIREPDGTFFNAFPILP
jgi:hypothetical protein